TLFSLISSAHDLPLLEQWCVEAAEDLSALASSLGVETEDNPSLALATSLNGAIPVFYGAGHLLPTARRAAAQFNENAKSLAFHGAVPEMEHNEVVGWDQRREGVVPVLIRRKKGEEGSPRDLEAKHMDIIAKELEGSGGCLELLAEGRNPLSEVLSVVFKVDMASVYSAVLKGVDPTPVEAIQRIKSAFSS
ncbi:MAG: hypothetical protein KAT70_09575, partial [Thermoplasmata archaeon]|nr:hypothetical protein [Thermoplasmata archaeon]